MMKVRPVFVVIGVVISSAVGCAEPGVIEVAPGGAIVGTGGLQPAAGATGAGSAAGASGAGGHAMATGGAGAGGTTTGSGGMGAGGTTVGTGGIGAGGNMMGTGGLGAETGGAGGAAGSGSGGSAALPDCPTGWTCTDPLKQITDLGAEGTVTDPSGAPIMYACGNGGAVECDQADPKGSCPELPNPFCAHVMVTGALAADLYSCAQLCTPKAP